MHADSRTTPPGEAAEAASQRARESEAVRLLCVIATVSGRSIPQAHRLLAWLTSPQCVHVQSRAFASAGAKRT